MTALKDLVLKVRSKNAGPFWLTIDIFCGSEAAFAKVTDRLKTQEVARLFKVPPEKLKRFDIDSLNAIKFSLPRPVVQGSIHDRDMHGASFAQVLQVIDI